MRLSSGTSFATALALLLVQASPSCANVVTPTNTFGIISTSSTSTSNINNIQNALLLDIRGGASKRRTKRGGKTSSLSSLSSSSNKNKKKNRTATGSVKVTSKNDKPKSALGDTMQKYKQILPLTKLHITLVGLATILGLVLGDENAQGLLGLDPIRTIYGMELWRPITAASFLGPPSISWLMSSYYLYEYGSSLERVYGTAQHSIFLALQVLLLTITSILFGQPFFASSIITAMLHVLSRSMPHQKVKWLIFTVPYWSLPYGLMASDVLQGGGAAALPHVLGIMTGHFYYFHKFVWPKMGGEEFLVAPAFLSRWLDPDSVENAARKSLDNALRNRKKGKGRKLSG